MCAKTVFFENKTDVNVYSVECNACIYNIVVCMDSQMFSTEILHRLLLSSHGEKISAAAAVSANIGKITVKAVFTNDYDPTVFDVGYTVFRHRS